jgi:hypothetical protein
MSNEQIMSDIYTRSAWGSQESRSGPSSTSQRTEQLRGQLPQLFSKFNIQSILDCGCGDWSWMSEVDLTNIEYIGVDIVDPLLDYLQTKYKFPNVRFQKMDVMEDPAETADLWFVRDLLPLYPTSTYTHFFQRFLESNSKYIALTSIETDEPNDTGVLGIWRTLNLREAPFSLKHPISILPDGKQWRRQKYMLVFSRDQIQTWMDTDPFRPIVEAPPQSTPHDTRDMNAYKLSNIPLRLRSLHDHRG